jgi:hypothetical protein
VLINFIHVQHIDNSPTATRIRDNQRRSRARHKEFVDGLQRRIQEYERRGVEATLQMQRAARDVAVENSRLRALLARNGINAEEVDTYLKSFGDQPSRDSSTTPITPNFDKAAVSLPMVVIEPQALASRPSPMPLSPLPRPTDDPSKIRCTTSRIPSRGGDPVRSDFIARVTSAEPPADRFPSITLAISPKSMDKLAVLADASIKRDSCGSITQCSEEESLGSNPDLQGALDETKPSSSAPRLMANISPMEMSCNAAARIISDMHGRDVDIKSVKDALGCQGAEECVVKNMTLYEVLEKH